MIGKQFRHRKTQGLYLVVAFAGSDIDTQVFNDCEIIVLYLKKGEINDWFTMGKLDTRPNSKAMWFHAMVQCKSETDFRTNWIVYKSAQSGELYVRPQSEFYEKFSEVRY